LHTARPSSSGRPPPGSHPPHNPGGPLPFQLPSRS
jgi:hypothetical protein